MPPFLDIFRSRRLPAKNGEAAPWKHDLLLRLRRSSRARRYLLRLERDGTILLTMPARGSRAEAMRFLERSEGWLLRRHAEWAKAQTAKQSWQDGSVVHFRGERLTLHVELAAAGTVHLLFGDQRLESQATAGDYRPAIQEHLRRLAERELPPRTRQLAAEHAIDIARVSIRSQKTRWGSCSARGTICLNWRLIHAPPWVVDYLIIHELMHRREMNHSARYWKLVAAAFPRWAEAEAWLKGTRIERLG